MERRSLLGALAAMAVQHGCPEILAVEANEALGQYFVPRDIESRAGDEVVFLPMPTINRRPTS